MEALFSLVILFLIAFVIHLATKRERPNQVRVHSRHGHRCYAEGLNQSELEIMNLLATNLSHKDYFIFNNLTIPSEHNGSSQIDHIVVSRFGIFVIESKNYNGWIYGNKNRKEWTQTFKNRKKFRLQNPLIQNYGHIACLKEHMPYVAKHIHNIVVFSQTCEFKTPRIENVLYTNELISYIKKFNEQKLKEVELLITIGHLSYMCQASHIPPDVHISNLGNRNSTED